VDRRGSPAARQSSDQIARPIPLSGSGSIAWGLSKM